MLLQSLTLFCWFPTSFSSSKELKIHAKFPGWWSCESVAVATRNPCHSQFEETFFLYDDLNNRRRRWGSSSSCGFQVLRNQRFLEKQFLRIFCEKGETAKVYYTVSYTHTSIACLCCASFKGISCILADQRNLQCERGGNIFRADGRFKITKKYLKINKQLLRISTRNGMQWNMYMRNRGK